MFPVSIRELNGCTSQHLFVVQFSVSSTNIVFIHLKSTGNDKKIQNICYTLLTVKHEILFTSSQKIMAP